MDIACHILIIHTVVPAKSTSHEKIMNSRRLRSDRRYFSGSRAPEIIDIAQGVGGSSNDNGPPSFVIRRPTVCRQYRPRLQTSWGRSSASILPGLENPRNPFLLSGTLARGSPWPWSFSPLILSPHLLSFSLRPTIRFLSLTCTASLPLRIRGSTYGCSFGNHIFFVSQFAAPLNALPPFRRGCISVAAARYKFWRRPETSERGMGGGVEEGAQLKKSKRNEGEGEKKRERRERGRRKIGPMVIDYLPRIPRIPI